jgi:hypothetical protein
VDPSSPASPESSGSTQSPNIYDTDGLSQRHLRLAAWAWFRAPRRAA